MTQNSPEQNASLIMRAQYVKDFSFENPTPLMMFEEDQEGDPQPNIAVNIEAKAQNLGERNFEVSIQIKVDATRKGKTMFLTELEYAGIVTVADSIDEEKVPHVVMVDAPFLLFPFARNIVSDATRDGGYPPLYLQPVDFASLYYQQQKGNGADTSANQ